MIQRTFLSCWRPPRLQTGGLISSAGTDLRAGIRGLSVYRRDSLTTCERVYSRMGSPTPDAVSSCFDARRF